VGTLDRLNPVELPNRMLTYDDGQVDTVTVVDPKTGLRSERPIKLTPEEERERSIRDLRRGLEGVEFRLLHVSEVMPWEDPLSAEVVERRTRGLQAERDFILAELERLDEAQEAEQ
jgi:hypothetical protein